MKYIISSTIIFLMLIHPVFAQNEKVEEVSSDVLNFFEKIYEKTILPVKRGVDTMKQNAMDRKSHELLEKTQNTIEEKQDELVDKAIEKTKKESKEMIKNWFKRKVQWIEEALSPLKIRIQQGSDWIREKIEGLKN